MENVITAVGRQCLLDFKNMKQKGFAPVLILLGVGALITVLAVISLSGKINFSFRSAPSPSPSAQVQSKNYTAKQLGILKDKDKIMENLDLNEQQFEILLEASENN